MAGIIGENVDRVKFIGLNMICEKGLPLKQTKDKKPIFSFLADDGSIYIELQKMRRMSLPRLFFFGLSQWKK